MKTKINKIQFGTDGWRAVMAKEFTFENVGVIGQAIADYLHGEQLQDPSVAIGYDTRFMSDLFAEKIANILASNNIRVYLSQAFIPTPVLSYTVKKRGLSAGVMITASHNPYIYNGVKFKGDYGGSAMIELTKNIEAQLFKNPVKEEPNAKVIKTDMFDDYKNHIEKLVDMDLIAQLGNPVVYSAMYGSGCGYIQRFFENKDLDILALQNEPRPDFNNQLPEPIPANLKELISKVKKSDAIAGFATDGDADRFGVIDETGEFVQLHDLMPILFEYLVKTRKLSGNVVRTTSMSDTIDRIAAEYDRKVIEVPVGFKNVCEQMLAEDILIGGEESGGFGFKGHIPERDGILSILLVLEMLAREKTSLSEKVKELRNTYGPFHYKRIDQHCDIATVKKNLENLIANTPDAIAGYPVDRKNTIDGLKIYFINQSWLLVRLSQTEPLFRIYCGGPDEKSVVEIITETEKILTK